MTRTAAHRGLASLFLACSALCSAQAEVSFFSKSNGPVVTTPHVRAELMAYAPDGVQADKPLAIGLQLQHQPGWHTYWRNPGDTGLATTLSWTLPKGSQAGAIAWPAPKKIAVADLVNYGYEDQVFLATSVTLEPDFQSVGAEFTIGLRAQWLVCKTECIPEQGEFTLKIPVHGTTAAKRDIFMAAQEAEPITHKGRAKFEPTQTALRLEVAGLPADWHGKQLEVFPEEGQIIERALKLAQNWTSSQWSTVMPLSTQRSQSPTAMSWVISVAGEEQRRALRLQATLDGAWQEAPAVKPSDISAQLAAALEQNKPPLMTITSQSVWLSPAYWVAILSALAGGLILNLMPCVLPVVAIKVLSLSQAKQRVSQHSGFFALGIVASFALLGALLMVLRSAGYGLGWGFQLQTPGIVAALALLFLAIGLNLLGVFELRFSLPQNMANAHFEHPRLQALASGALTVLIATPCTAPFMGASLGLAVSLPAAPAIFIFTALGMGMATPFILMTALPKAASCMVHWLPKPGPWMEVLRRILALPMFATALWLAWVLVQQGTSPTEQAGKEVALQATPDKAVPSAVWLMWTPQAQQAARATGRPVFVDFTAAWCLTCQVNKATTLNRADTVAAFKAKNVILLRADWTEPNAAIAAELTKLGRSGLPVYALYAPASAAPQLLPEVLTKSIVFDALAGL